MPDVLSFLKDILTDMIRGNQIKINALELYTELITTKEKEEHTGELTFIVPGFAGYTFYIHQKNYDIVKGFMKDGMKLRAIKHLRETCWIYVNGVKENSIGLREAKEFVEQHEGFN